MIVWTPLRNSIQVARLVEPVRIVLVAGRSVPQSQGSIAEGQSLEIRETLFCIA